MTALLEPAVANDTDATRDGVRRQRLLACLIHAEERMFGDLLTSVLSIRAGLEVSLLNGSATARQVGSFAVQPDLLVLVVPPWNVELTLDLAARFLQTSPRGRVIAVTGPGREFMPPPWLADRLAAIIDRNEPLQHLWNVLDKLLGKSQTAPAGGLRSRLGGRSLSARESEIFQLIGDGLTNHEIAAQLGLSAHTVRTHRKRIAAKLGTEGAELTRWAILSRQTGFPAANGQSPSGNGQATPCVTP